MKKSKRQSKNVVTDKSHPVMKEFKNIEIRKPLHTVMDGREQWVGDTPSKDQQARHNRQALEDNMHNSPHIRTKTRVHNQELDPSDKENNTRVFETIGNDPVRAGKNFRQLQETNKPGRFSKRTQVTPGKWTTKKIKK